MTGLPTVSTRYVCGECGLRYERAGTCANDGALVAPVEDLLLGTEVGRYRLARVLGEGGMGRVYLGVQPMIGSRVAIKVLSEECARDPALLERFFAEARAVNLIRHENIVGVLDLAQLPGGRPYIVMEFVAGRTFADLVKARPPLDHIIQIMREVLSALAAAHAIGIVHRDLKPDNIMVTAEGHAKVLDFGIAKLAPGMRGASAPRTQTGSLLGTPAYMSPEQVTGSASVDARTDVYAAGVVLFEAVTGRPPFAALTVFELLRKHVDEAPPRPRALRPDLPVGVEQVILTALAKAPGQRFADAAAMGQALQAVAWGTAVSALTFPTRPPRRSFSALAVVAIAAGVLLVGGVGAGLAVHARTVEARRAADELDAELQLRHTHIGPAAAPPRTDPEDARPDRDPPLDYTPSHFDPIAYLPRALARAQALLPDAQFTEFEFYENVWSDGHVDLTLPTSNTSYYEFRSAKASERAPNHPKNLPQERPCYVMVDVTATGTSARVRRDDACDHELKTAPPRCTFADVWKKAIADHEPAADMVATVAFLHDATWFYDSDHGGSHPGESHVHVYPDCR